MNKKKEKSMIRNLLLDFSKKNVIKLAVSAIFIIFLAIAQSILLPGLLGGSLQLINDGEFQMLYRILGEIFSISVFVCIVMLLCKRSLWSVKKGLDIFLQKTFVRYLWLDEHFQERNREELSVLFRDTITGFSEEVVGYLKRILYMVVVLAIGSIYSWRLSPLLYCICITLTVIMTILLRSRVNVLKKRQEDFTLVSQEVNKKSWEQVLNHEVELFLNPDRVISGYQDTNGKLLKCIFLLKKTGNMFQAITMFTSFILLLCIEAIGGILVLFHQIPMAVLYSMLFVLPNISKELFGIPELISDFGKIKGIGSILCDNFKAAELEPSSAKKERLPEINEIHVCNVTFGYKEELLFSDISFMMKSGEYWAFIGRIGCGKSTLLKLLIKSIPYEIGSIAIDGADLQKLDRRLWWNSISYLDQEPRFIQGTILENILMDREFQGEQVEKVIAEADMCGIIAKLPQGLRSSIEKLSSGEKQKVCFARAFYRDNRILFLDEATSALDEESEKRLCGTLKAKAEQGWLIVGISHREYFSRSANRILRFEGKTAVAGEGGERGSNCGA